MAVYYNEIEKKCKLFFLNGLASLTSLREIRVAPFPKQQKAFFSWYQKNPIFYRLFKPRYEITEKNSPSSHPLSSQKSLPVNLQ